jgi:S1-C subfamily serine protease/tRNA A-37 threonylcarbamoyl transferase component Bud32
MQDLVGKTIGQYQIVEQIGQGGMATVYKGFQPSMNRYVAIKVLSRALANDKTFVQRFRQEAQAIAQLEHAYILPIYDYGEQNGLIYMVTRYVAGGTLKDQMTQTHSPQEALQIIRALAGALDYAHSRGIVHRDVKPSNILIDPQGQPLLTDFGIAKMMEGTLNLTASGVIGTPTYMSPEQAQGQPIDGRTDIYALGIVLYELLVGSPPYQAETPVAVAMKQVTEPLPSPRLKRPDLSIAIEKIILKALAKDPADRYQTAGELADSLETALAELKTVVPPPSPPASAEPQARRRPSWVLWLGGGAAALCLVATLCVGFFMIVGSKDKSGAGATATVVARSNVAPEVTPTVSEAPTSVTAAEAEPMPTSTASPLPFHSVVQIWTLQKDGDGWSPLWSGSGSIVTPDGYILTNAHVVLPDKNYDVDGLLVSLTLDTDQPPEPTYLAEVVVADLDLDLAVIRVTSDLDGKPVDYSSLNLPAIPLGDSDDLELGTPISILGYPGIGGETITLTRGEVAGFVTEPEVKGRAFIKTSATIAGGNSGGMAITEDGHLIGVPTQLGYGGEGEFVDCRVLADTNGDGIVDDRDGCIPTGGFINALRPINLGRPFIQDAIAGVVRRPPEPERPVVESPPDAGEVLSLDDFSDPDSGWSTSTNKETSRRYENGQFVIEVAVEGTIAWSTLDQEYADVDFEVETIKLGGPDDNGFGVILRYQDRDNFYLFEISSDGFYQMGLFENDEWTTLVDWTKTDLINPGDRNVIAAEAQGNRFTLFINGVEVDQVYDDTFGAGTVGLAAETMSEPNVSIGFDSARLRTPGGPREVTVVPGDELSTETQLIYSDDFSVDSGDWYSGSDEDSASGYEAGEYFIQVIRNQLEVWSSRPMDNGDVIIEVEARKVLGPDLNSFGVLCRYLDADNFYALEIGSDGTYAIRKASDGELETLVDWTEAEAIQPGEAWNQLRAACLGNELSLWANDVLLVSTTDDDFPSGDVALAVGTYDEGNVRVHFDNLAIFTPVSVGATDTAGTLLSDDFSDESIWPVGEETGSRFFYDDGEYYIEVFESEYAAWASSGDSWGDVMIDVDARQVSGPNDNQYGLYCRYQDADNFYEFDISGDGYYAIFLQQGGEYKTLAKWTATNAIRQGQASNHLTVLCQEDRLALWINGKFEAEVFDDTFSDGEIALTAGSFDEPGVLIAFDNLRASRP